MGHDEAVDGGLLKTMSQGEMKQFTPSELLLYKIASEHRYMQVHTSMYPYILACTSTYIILVLIYLYILVHTLMY